VLVKTFTSAPSVAQEHFPLIPARLLASNRFDNLEKIRKCNKPIFIAHGDSDRLIPFEQGHKLYLACHSGARLLVLRDSDHNDPLPGEFYAILKQFFDSEARIRVSFDGFPGFKEIN